MSQRISRYFLYIIISACITMAWALLALINKTVQTSYFDFFAGVFKILMIIVIILGSKMITGRWILLSFRKIRLWHILLALFPALMELVGYAAPVTSIPRPIVVIDYTFAVFLTAVWEELYYRYIPNLMFGINHNIRITEIVLCPAVFAAAHFCNLILNGLDKTVIQIVLAYCMGVFFMGLYMATDNILLPIISHFFLNFCTGFFQMFNEGKAPMIFEGHIFMIYLGICVFGLLAGYTLMGIEIRKQNHVHKKEPAF